MNGAVRVGGIDLRDLSLADLIVDPVSVAAIAAGADGLIIEVHNQPEEALSDGDQSIYLDQFETLQKRLVKAASIDNRRFDFQGPAVNIPS